MQELLSMLQAGVPAIQAFSRVDIEKPNYSYVVTNPESDSTVLGIAEGKDWQYRLFEFNLTKKNGEYYLDSREIQDGKVADESARPLLSPHLVTYLQKLPFTFVANF
ncbi:MAG: hypothetical protein AB4372_15230 [Xenococcus sp. (in: cyanobacteria)]